MGKCWLVAAAIFIFCLPFTSRAQTEPTFNRVTSGLDIGGGMSADLNNLGTQGSFFAGLRVGGAFNENFRLFGEFTYTNIFFHANNTRLLGLFCSPQYSFNNRFYIRPAIGVQFGDTYSLNNKGEAVFLPGTETGFSGGMYIGYIIWTKALVGGTGDLGPELIFNYVRIGGVNVFNYGLLLSLSFI